MKTCPMMNQASISHKDKILEIAISTQKVPIVKSQLSQSKTDCQCFKYIIHDHPLKTYLILKHSINNLNITRFKKISKKVYKMEESFSKKKYVSTIFFIKIV